MLDSRTLEERERERGREREREQLHPTSHLGLMGRRSSLQNVQTLHDKADNRHKVILPQKLNHSRYRRAKKARIAIPDVLNSRAAKNKMVLIPNVMRGTMSA
jgi:hypothetical protein